MRIRPRWIVSTSTISMMPRKDAMTGSREQQFHVYLYERIIGRLHRRDNLTRFVFE